MAAVTMRAAKPLAAAAIAQLEADGVVTLIGTVDVEFRGHRQGLQGKQRFLVAVEDPHAPAKRGPVVSGYERPAGNAAPCTTDA